MKKTVKFLLDINKPFNFIGFLIVTGFGLYLFGPKFLAFTIAYNFRIEVEKQ